MTWKCKQNYAVYETYWFNKKAYVEAKSNLKNEWKKIQCLQTEKVCNGKKKKKKRYASVHVYTKYVSLRFQVNIYKDSNKIFSFLLYLTLLW